MTLYVCFLVMIMILEYGCDIQNFEINMILYFDNINDYMLAINECDLIWKIMHGAIPTGRCLYGYTCS